MKTSNNTVLVLPLQNHVRGLLIFRRCVGLQAILLAFLCCWLAGPIQAAENQVVRGNIQPVLSRLAKSPVSRLGGSTSLHLAIGLPMRDPAGMTRALQELYDPANPRFHQWLTPVEVTAKFGPTEQDYQAVVAWAKSKSLTVTAQHPNRLVVEVDGAAADIEKAFNVSLQVYEHPTEARTFFAPERDPSLDLAVKVLTVDGLDNFYVHHSNNHLRPEPVGNTGSGTGSSPSGGSTPNGGTGPGGAYGGCDFRAAYVPGTTLTGAGQNVAVEEFNDYFPLDISNYETQFGLPATALVNVVVNGPMPAPGTGNADGEVSLDIEMIIAMAPGVQNIYVYEAPNSTANDVPLLSRMQTDDLCRQISCSWSGGGPNPTAEGIFQSMALQGQSYFNAVGDGDAFTGAIGFPSDSPNVTECGGTTLTTAGPCGAYTSEKVWNWGLVNGSYVGSSGGVSTYYSIPWWQQGINMVANQGSTSFRNVPDVALTADNIWVRYADGGSGNFGGTSCAAPLWAGFTALVNQEAAAHFRPGIGFLNPALYAMGKSSTYTADFHDVTTGNNFWPSSPSKFAAVAGYDLCTGWGTPAGQSLINYLAGDYGVPNGGFETGDFSLWTQFGTTSGDGVATFYAHSGAYGAFFGDVGTIGGIYQELPTVPGQVYLLSFWLENFGGPTNEFAAYCNGTLLDLVNVAPFGWQEYQYNVLASDISTFIEFYGRNDPSYFGLDDVTLTPLPGNLGITPGEPRNGGFEAGNFSSWIQSGNTASTYVDSYLPDAHSGTNCAALGPVGTLGYLSQLIPTVPGQTYLLSFWLKNLGNTNNEFSLAWNGSSIFDITNWGVFDWENFEYIVRATNASTLLQFGFRNDPTYFHLDDVRVTPLAGPLLGQAAYVRSTNGEPWGTTDSDTAMNRVLGTANWNDARYETVDPSALFSPVVHFIYMEGSDIDANALNDFLNKNRATMQSWVSNGGSLFINAAPNEGGSINLGFGVTLNYDGSEFCSNGVVALPSNPIFNGPYEPVGASWTGNFFSHATVSGAGLTPLIVNATNSNLIILAEMFPGQGHALFGGMTENSFHSPQPQAANLRANILEYGNTTPQGTFDDLPPSAGLPVPVGYRGLTWSNFVYLDGLHYAGNPSGYAAGVVSPNNVAFNGYGAPASIISSVPINFFSAEMTAAWNDNLTVEAKGFVNGVLTYDQTYTLSATAPTLVVFDFLGVTKVDFTSSGGTPHSGYSGSGFHFVMDDVVTDAAQGAPAGADHFGWSGIGSPQVMNAPFAVTVTAETTNSSLASGFVGAASLSGWTLNGTLIEGFESGIWPHAPWVITAAGTPGTLSTASPHNGSYDLIDPDWDYRTDVSLGNTHAVVSMWVRPSNATVGRAYLGFGASADGCWALTAAPNTSQFMLQQVTNGFGIYTPFAANSQAWVAGHWYKMVAVMTSPTSVICNLYDSDGVTLLNTLTYTAVTGLPGGVAMRSFGTFSLDTIQGGAMQPVAILPESSDLFSGSSWSGNVTVLQPEGSMVLIAEDGFGGPAGVSNPFQVNIVPPVFGPVTRFPGGIDLTWPTYPGASYQLQYKTNLLLQPNWVNLGGVLTAISNSMTVPDIIGTDPQRFYRLALLP